MMPMRGGCKEVKIARGAEIPRPTDASVYYIDALRDSPLFYIYTTASFLHDSRTKTLCYAVRELYYLTDIKKKMSSSVKLFFLGAHRRCRSPEAAVADAHPR